MAVGLASYLKDLIVEPYCKGAEFMKFEVLYEVPPMRGIFRTEIDADSVRDAEEKIRTNSKTKNYRIKKIGNVVY